MELNITREEGVPEAEGVTCLVCGLKGKKSRIIAIETENEGEMRDLKECLDGLRERTSPGEAVGIIGSSPLKIIAFAVCEEDVVFMNRKNAVPKLIRRMSPNALKPFST
jgi:hypothetical protein